MSGDPTCIYSHLRGWEGGYSIDYGRVRHVHISYSPPGSGYLAGREWRARFAHWGGGYHHRRSQRHYALPPIDYHSAPARDHVADNAAHSYAVECGLLPIA